MTCYFYFLILLKMSMTYKHLVNTISSFLMCQMGQPLRIEKYEFYYQEMICKNLEPIRKQTCSTKFNWVLENYFAYIFL